MVGVRRRLWAPSKRAARRVTLAGRLEPGVDLLRELRDLLGQLLVLTRQVGVRLEQLPELLGRLLDRPLMFIRASSWTNHTPARHLIASGPPASLVVDQDPAC